MLLAQFTFAVTTYFFPHTMTPTNTPQSNNNPSNFPPQTQAKILGTLRNQFGTAEGTALPPIQAGQYRVPFVTNLQVLQVQPYGGGVHTQATISFNTPTTSQEQIDHYSIYVGYGTAPTNFTFASAVTSSPATVLVNYGSNATFVVQTVLKNGFVSALASSPSCTTITPTAGAQLILHLGSTQSIPTGVETKIVWDTVDYDPSNNMWTAGAPTRLVAPIAGFYSLQLTVDFQGSGGGTQRIIYFRLNGSVTTILMFQDIPVTGTLNIIPMSTSRYWFMNANDYVECSVLQDSGGALVIGANAAKVTTASMILLQQ